MAKRHDENKCLRSFGKIGKIDYSNGALLAAKIAIIGIHMWGKIDFLTKYCGWKFYWDNNAVPMYLSNPANATIVKKKKKVKPIAEKPSKKSNSKKR